MRSLNTCAFIGNLTRDPETRSMPNGNKVTNITIAVNDSYKDSQGNMVDQAEFVRVVFFGKLAETAEQYLHKGSKIYVSGKFKTRKWEKDGIQHYSTEISCDSFGGQLQFLDSKPSGDQNNQGQRQQQQGSQQQSGGYHNNSQQGAYPAAGPDVGDGMQIPFAPLDSRLGG